jgi:AcrR family transcriptional regulator
MTSAWTQRHSPDSSIRERVSRALIELCDERGFADLGVADLCRRAEIESAVFEAHYFDLENCFVRVYEELAADFLARVSAAFESREAWRDKIRAVAYEFVAYLREDRARANFTLVESLRAGERTLLIRDRAFGCLVGFVDLGREQPEAPASITAATAESIAGGIFNLMRLALETEQTERYTEVLPELMYTVVLTYLGPEAAAEELEIEPPALVALSGGP